MNILITGGAGYIGNITAAYLLKQGYDVVIVDKVPPMVKTTTYLGDFSDSDLLNKIFRTHYIDSVCHFAAMASVDLFEPSYIFTNNMTKGITLLDIMRQHGCNQLIFSSTGAVYGESQYLPIDEKHPQHPINPYGESKLMFEKILKWYHRAYGLKFIAFRFFNAAGAWQSLGDHHGRHLINRIIEKSDLCIYGDDYPTNDGTCIRDYVHVLDLARAVHLGIKQLDTFPNGIYNLGSGRGFSVLEVIHAVQSGTDGIVDYRIEPRRLGDPAILIANSEKAHQELGWEPQFSDLMQIVKDIIINK